MAPPIEIKVDHKRLSRALQAAPVELLAAMRVAGADIGNRYLGFHRARQMRGPPGIKGTKRGLRSHFRVDLSGSTLDRLRIWIGTRSRVALEHEEGRELRAREGKFMALPMEAAKTSGGKTKKTAARLLKARSLVPIRRGGKTFLAQRKGKKRLVFLFHLVEVVRLKPRLRFLASWGGFLPTAIKRFNRAIGFALAAARRKAR